MRTRSALLALLFASGNAIVLAAPVAGRVSFNREIRPIMADTCFRCHGPDKGTRMAGLRLDIREEATKTTASGVVPIVPGDPAKSAIVERVFSSSKAKVMPPVFAHKELTGQQKETIRRWVEQGAEYENHWSYQPIQRPAVPEVAGTSHPVDAFIQSRLAKEGLRASAEADRRTLLRRVTLDLTGLPPTPDDTAAYLADQSPRAFENVVDRLLNSPGYAEKQAMHWLDAVRYADTCGFHGDNPFPAWPYRDYVLASFRDNKPFDVFTREQLAGDLIPGAGREQLVASAYNRLNRTSAEGGLQPKEYLAKYAADRVRTVAAVWMGATVGCAECHDHKFDPFASKDFYALKAFFADIEETGLVPDRGGTAWGTQLALPTPEQQAALSDLGERVAKAKSLLADALAASSGKQEVWEQTLLARYEAGDLAWKVQRPITATSANGAMLTIYNDRPVESNTDLAGSIVRENQITEGLIVASGPNPNQDVYEVTFKPGAGKWAALGVQLFQDESLQGVRFARGGDRMAISEIEAEATTGTAASKLNFKLATVAQTFPGSGYPAMALIDGNRETAWGIVVNGEPQRVMMSLRFDAPLETSPDTVVKVRLRQETEFRRVSPGRFRVALTANAASWPVIQQARAKQRELNGLSDAVLTAIRKDATSRTDADRKALSDYFAWSLPDVEDAYLALARAERDHSLADGAIPRIVVTKSKEPDVTRVLPRGNWMDESGDVVTPAIPAMFGKLEPAGGRATRLDLADWLVSSQNPLTARVVANRIWRQFFGTGISKVLDDVGSQGEAPVHGELLDWLASEFVSPQWDAEDARPWDMKHLIRAIVTSHTYRQASLARPDVEAKDPYNRLLARQSPVRVDAEVVRDVALAASGLLSDKFGGPSAKPYQPDGYLAALNFPKRGYSESNGEDLYRRGVYVHWQRSFLHPSLLTFDAPTREECTVNRVSSNTPLQALVMLNDPIYMESARVFAQNALRDGGKGFANQLDWIFERALARRPDAIERRMLTALHQRSLTRFTAAPKEAAKLASVGEFPMSTGVKPVPLAAMTTVTRAVLNLSETITRR